MTNLPVMCVCVWGEGGEGQGGMRDFKQWGNPSNRG